MHIINEIIKKRRESVIFLQKCFRQFVLRRKLVSFAKRHTNYYSVYPSREDFNKISIKLYTNLKDPSQCVELPVRFCEKRNCYIFDIPKAKFPSKKKFMCFNFVLDDSTIVDSKYNCIFFGGKYVNQIDFNAIDKKELKIQKSLKSYMYLYKKILFKNENNKRIDISKQNEDQISPTPLKSNNIMNLSFSQNSCENKLLRSLTLKNSKSSYINSLSNSGGVNLDTSTSEEKRSRKKKRNKSILKEHRTPKNNSSKTLDFKKVSFGWVETSE